MHEHNLSSGLLAHSRAEDFSLSLKTTKLKLKLRQESCNKLLDSRVECQTNFSGTIRANEEKRRRRKRKISEQIYELLRKQFFSDAKMISGSGRRRARDCFEGINRVTE